MCCDVLGVVGPNFKLVKFFMQMLHDVVVVGPGSSGTRTSSIFNTQHVATCCKSSQNVANALNMLRPTMLRPFGWELANAGPTMLRCVVLMCCDRLTGVLGRFPFDR